MRFRFSSLEDREEFYKKEFNIKKVVSYFRIKPSFLAVDFGTETGIIKDKKKLNTLLILRADFKTLKNKLINYLPEDVYYDRNIYRNPEKCLKCMDFKKCLYCKNWLGQELAFDLDADNIKCKCKNKKIRICKICLKKAKEKTVEFYYVLKKKFEKVHIVYTGRGFHLVIRDKEAYKLSIKEREKLNKEFKEFPIDPWVSRGRIRLMRLPYSLNGLVSRIVLPLKIKELEKFNLDDKKVIPKFL